MKALQLNHIIRDERPSVRQFQSSSNMIRFKKSFNLREECDRNVQLANYHENMANDTMERYRMTFEAADSAAIEAALDFVHDGMIGIEARINVDECMCNPAFAR